MSKEVKCPTVPLIWLGRGVVRHNIDRCIISHGVGSFEIIIDCIGYGVYTIYEII